MEAGGRYVFCIKENTPTAEAQRVFLARGAIYLEVTFLNDFASSI
jgi:hypothetical protein